MRTSSVIAGLTCIAAVHAPAQEADKVEQYRGMLLKRPENTVLFGRLVDAWLEKGEMAGLKEMLESKSAAGGAADWRLLAVFRSYSGDEAGAITALDEALKKSPDDPQTRLARAKALGAASRFEEALADLEIAAKVPAVQMEAGTLRGKFLARAGRPADAVKAWLEVIAAHPEDEGLREDLIELEIGEGLLEEAAASATELADKTADPYQKALRQMRVAEIFAQAGKKNEAVEKYRAVFAVSAESSWLEREVLARVNALFSRDDDTAGLREFYDRLRETYPRRVVVKKEAARSLMAAGEGDEAVAMFREVLKVLPGDREARDEFIALLEGAGRHKDAADEIAALLATADKDAALWEKLAGIRKAMGDEAGLKEAVEKAVALAPQDEAGRISAAGVYERYGRSDDAERCLREAVKSLGLAGEAGDALAVFLANHGKAEEAVGLWREMAKGADREGLLRIVRSLTANGRAPDAYGILSSRMADLGGDPLLLAALCQSAQFSDQSEGAIPQALDLVRQAKTPGDLESALRQALALVFRAKEPKKWIDELAAKETPSTQELCLLAEMNETQGDSIEADRILKKAMESGDPLLAAAQRVRLFELRGDFASAIAATRDWLALPGGLRTEQVKRLVNLHERSGDNEAALKETENWKRIAPGDKLAWVKRAELFQADGRSGEAVAELRRALAKFGNEEEMRSKLASALSESGMEPEAWRMYYNLYDEAESPASKLKWAGSLAELAAREGKEEELLNDFKRRARDNPSSVVPLLAMAEMYRAWQQPEEELRCLSEASRRKPDDAALLQRQADIEEDSGSNEKAEELLKSAIRVQDTPDNRRRLSAFWIRGGESERGLAELLATKGGAGPRDTEKLVMPLADTQDWESVVRILGPEVPRRPEDWRLAYLQALALRESGKKDEAFGGFAALLDARGDLPGVQPLIPVNQMQWMPSAKAGLSDFRMFSQFQMFTSRSPQNRRMYYGMNQQGVPLPGTPAEARWMALSQALALAGENPDTRAARLAALNSSEIAALEFIKSVYDLKPEELKERMMADNADPLLFRWYVERMNFNPYQERTPDPKLLRRGVDICLKKDPEIALMLMQSLPLTGENGLGTEGARQMLDLIAALDDEHRLEYLTPLRMLVFADEKSVPREIRDKAETLMLGLLDRVRQKYGNPWLADAIAVQRMRAGRFDDAVVLLNQTYESGKNPAPMAAQNQARMYGMYGRQMPGAAGKLAFPMALATSVSPTFQSEFGGESPGRASSQTPAHKKLLELLGEASGAYNPGQPGQESRTPVDPDSLVKALPKIADPYLRVFLANSVGKPEVVEREVGELEKSRADDSAALYIAAAYQFSVAKQPAKAYALLSKACQFAKADNTRDLMDWQLCDLGADLAAKASEGLDLEPARRAALRLRKSMSRDEDSKRKLAAIMDKLGLEEEGKRYATAPKPVMSLRQPYGASSGRRIGRGSQRELDRQALANLAGQGKRETAARRALGEIRRAKAASSQNPNSSYEERQMIELVLSLKLEDELVKISQPAAGAGFNSRREFAMLLTRLKKMEQALPLLRELATEKPDDFEVRTALLLALPKEEQKSYVLTLAEGKIDSDRLGLWFQSLFENRDGGDEKVESYLAGVEMLVVFLEKLQPSFDPQCNLSWVNYFSQGLFRNYSFGDVRLKPLGGSSGGSGKFDEARTARRDALARRLHEAMLRHPQTSEQGFILMMGNKIALGTNDETLDKAARAAVKLGFRMQPDEEEMMRYGGNRSQMLWTWRTSDGSGRSRGNPERAIKPMTYLIRHAADGKGANPFSPEFLADLIKDDSESGKSFGECLKITDSPGLDAFAAWKDKAKDSPQTELQKLLWINRLAYFKKRGDILDAASDFACDLALGKTDHGSGRYSGEVVEVLALAVSDAEGLQAKTKVIDRITRKILGPPEAWALYGDYNSNPGAYAIQMRAGIFQRLGQSLQDDRENMVAMARFAAENRILTSNSDFRNYNEQWQTNGDAEAIARNWRESGIFSPGPALAGTIRNDGISLVESMESITSHLDDDVKKKLGGVLLKSEGPERFWERLFGAHLANDSGAAAKELDREAGAISKWPPHCREGLARTVIKWFPTAEKSAGAGIRRLLADSRKQGDAEVRKQAETYLKDGFPPDTRPYSISNSLGVMMRRLVADDPELAAKVWLKALDFFQTSQGGFSSRSNGFSRSATQYANSELLQAFGGGDTSVPMFAEFVVLLEKGMPGATSGMFDSNSDYYLRELCERYRQGLKDDFMNDKALAEMKPETRLFVGILKKLDEETSEDTRPIAAHLYLMDVTSNSSSSSNSSRPQMLEWVRKNLVKSAPDLANAALVYLQWGSDKDQTDADKQELRQAFSSLVKDARVPVLLRAFSAGRLISRQPEASWMDDASCSSAMADMLVSIPAADSQWAASETPLKCFTRFSQLDSTSPGDAARVIAALKANPPELGNGGAPRGTVTAVNGFMLSLAMRGGDKAEVVRLVKSGGDGLRGNLDFALRLWRGNYPEAAASLIARPGEYHRGMQALLLSAPNNNSKAPRFTREMEAGLTAWLASIPDPGQRFRVECVISCAPDAKGDQAPEKKRVERIEALVKRFPAEGPKQRVSRNEVLAVLGNEPGPAKALAAEYVEAVSRQTLGSLLPLRHGNSENADEINASYVPEILIRRAMQYSLEESGDVSLAVAQFDSINPVPNGNQEYYARRMLDEIGVWYSGMVASRIFGSPADKRAGLAGDTLGLCRILLEKSREQAVPAAVALSVMSAAAAGDGSVLEKWLAELPGPVKEIYDKFAAQRSLSDAVGKMVKSNLAGNDHEARRRELLSTLLNDPAIAARVIRHMTDISTLMDSGAFTREEILAAIDALPEKHPRRAEFLCEKAGIIGWRTDNAEQALTAYDAAEAAAAGDAKALDFVKSYRVMYLDSHGKPDDALVVAKAINIDNLPERERKTVDGVLKKDAAKENKE